MSLYRHYIKTEYWREHSFSFGEIVNDALVEIVGPLLMSITATLFFSRSRNVEEKTVYLMFELINNETKFIDINTRF